MRTERLRAAVAGVAVPAEENQESLNELLSRIARGDREAFTAVYRQVAAPVYALVRAMTGDDARSERITTEALTEVWRLASRYTPAAGGGLSWVMKIAGRHAAGLARTGLPAQVVSLALHGGFDQDEISSLLGLTPEAVSGLLRDGLLHPPPPAAMPEGAG